MFYLHWSINLTKLLYTITRIFMPKQSKKADKNYIEDTETTPKSCLDVVFGLLATTAGTSSSNSLPESVQLLDSQLQVERHRLDVMRQEAEWPRKSVQNSDAYFLVQQQALKDLSAKQEKVNKLAKHLASIMGTQDIVSWAVLKWFQFWTCFAAAFIYFFVPYICTSGELWCPVDVICVISLLYSLGFFLFTMLQLFYCIYILSS